MNARRGFLSAIGAGAFALVLPAAAQRARFRICWISPTPAADGSPFVEEFRNGMRDAGYIEGRDVSVEVYWGENSDERVAKLVAEVVASRPHVIVAQGRTAPPVARATSSLPVVFGFSGDVVEAGLVESLSRPGRNLTGISFLVVELIGKRFELLKALLPGAKRVAVVANPQHPGDRTERRASQAAAEALGLSLEYFEAGNTAELRGALAEIEKTGSNAVMFFPVQNVINNREHIAAWAIRNRLPAISGWAQFAEGGNLMSYGPNLREACRRLAVYVDRILKGARPAELPVELPRTVELVINLRTAKALAIPVSRALLERADRLIE